MQQVHCNLHSLMIIRRQVSRRCHAMRIRALQPMQHMHCNTCNTCTATYDPRVRFTPRADNKHSSYQRVKGEATAGKTNQHTLVKRPCNQPAVAPLPHVHPHCTTSGSAATLAALHACHITTATPAQHNNCRSWNHGRAASMPMHVNYLRFHFHVHAWQDRTAAAPQRLCWIPTQSLCWNPLRRVCRGNVPYRQRKCRCTKLQLGGRTVKIDAGHGLIVPITQTPTSCGPDGSTTACPHALFSPDLSRLLNVHMPYTYIYIYMHQTSFTSSPLRQEYPAP